MMNIVSDPDNVHDPAYMGHVARDAATCASFEEKEQYESQRCGAT
jgi:hypothetical protein